jgi:molybdopterin converting factor subunit 1
MQVSVRFFASLREIAGTTSISLDLPEGSTVESAWQALARTHPALAARRSHVVASINRRYATFDATLHDQSEIAFIPPVSGG